LFVLWGVLFTKNLAPMTTAILNYVIGTFGWVYIIATFGFLAFVIYLACSRFGRTRLGQDTDCPEFRTASWLVMMFRAGMGSSSSAPLNQCLTQAIRRSNWRHRTRTQPRVWPCSIRIFTGTARLWHLRRGESRAFLLGISQRPARPDQSDVLSTSWRQNRETAWQGN
jgi:hypothetical protein